MNTGAYNFCKYQRVAQTVSLNSMSEDDEEGEPDLDAPIDEAD